MVVSDLSWSSSISVEGKNELLAAGRSRLAWKASRSLGRCGWLSQRQQTWVVVDRLLQEIDRKFSMMPKKLCVAISGGCEVGMLQLLL